MRWLSPGRGARGAVACIVLAAGCEAPAPARDAGSAGPTQPASAAAPPKQAAAAMPKQPTAPGRAEPAPVAAGQSVDVPAASLRLGSAPDTPHRDHASEALLVPTEVAAFTIDRLPYPNDPAQPPKTGVDRPGAARLCAAEGKRLCSEAEWELACKTADGLPYPTGEHFDAEACAASAARCGNGIGAMGMGTTVREWTASEAPGGLGNPLRTAVLRGATAGEPAFAHRCAARSGATADSLADDIGFRCCSGPAPRFTYPRAKRRALIQPLSEPIEKLRKALSADSALAKLAGNFEPFSAADVSRALARGKRGRSNITAWHIADATFVWSPGPGQTLWVLSGHSGERSLLAAIYPMPDGSFVPATSVIIEEPDMSVALGYTEDKPTQLLWTTCFGCPGEGGDLEIGEDGVPRLSYR